MIVPTIATVVVGTNGLIGHFEHANNADRARTLAAAVQAAGELVHALQDERAARGHAARRARDADQEDARAAYATRKAGSTTRSGPHYRSAAARSADLPGNFRAAAATTSTSASAELPASADQVVAETLRAHRRQRAATPGLINDLLDIRDSAAQLAGDTSSSDRMRAAAAIARAKEFLSQQRVVVPRGAHPAAA